MAEFIERETVTDGGSLQSPDSSLVLREVADRCLWSIQPGRQDNLNAFTRSVFASAPRPGEVLQRDSLRLLQLWPHKAFLLSSTPELPQAVHDFEDIITDIGHGFCEFHLGGEAALDFLGDYCSTDLATQWGAEIRSLRCLLGQYQILLWWDDSDDIRLLVDRSYAHSFYDYLDRLMARWSRQTP